MPETQTQTAAPVVLTAEQFSQLLAAAKADAPSAVPAGAAVQEPVETAPTAPVNETVDEKVNRLVAEKLAAAGVKAPVEETAEQRQERLIEEGVQKAIGAYVAQNGVQRKGLVESGHRGVHGGTVTQAPGVAGNTVVGFDKPLHQLSPEEWQATAGVAIERHVMGARSVYNQG